MIYSKVSEQHYPSQSKNFIPGVSKEAQPKHHQVEELPILVVKDPAIDENLLHNQLHI